MTTITETVPGLGSPPLTSDPANFDSRADTLYGTSLPATITSINTWAGQANTVAGEVNANASTASSAAVLATAAAGATLWVSGASYDAGDAAISTVDFQAYRANTSTSGTTDPSLSADWTLVTIGAPPGGAMIYISTITASAAAAVDIEGFDSTYDVYVIECANVTRSVDDQIYGQVKVGGSWISTSTYDSHTSQPNSNSTSYSGVARSGGTYIDVFPDTGAAAGEGLGGTIKVYSPSATGRRKIISVAGGCIQRDGYHVSFTGSGSNRGTDPITGLRLLTGDANTISGTFRLYGIKNS